MGAKVIIALLVVMGIITFFAYLIDKKKAEKGKWRTKEKTLLGLSFFFGSIGGLLGLYVIRHKTKHWYFKFGFPLITLAEIIAVVVICVRYI